MHSLLAWLHRVLICVSIVSHYSKLGLLGPHVAMSAVFFGQLSCRPTRYGPDIRCAGP